MKADYSVTYTHLFHKAWPIILANAAVPLVGFVDTAVIGNIGTTEDLGAIAFGALIFSFVYWGFGFLRMGTTGFAAQARGAGNEAEVRAVLGRALLLAVSLGSLLIIAQIPIRLAAFAFLEGSPNVETLAQSYFSIRIWGAPATLATFALMGLLIGLGNSKQLLFLQLFLNGLNIILDLLFAGYLGLGAAGIALGTVLAELTTVIVAGILIITSLSKSKKSDKPFWTKKSVFNRAAILKTISSNFNIMIRTLLLVFSFAYFTNQSAQFGDITLAANHILLQLVSFAAFFLDGFAFVAEALVGKTMGEKFKAGFDDSVAKTSILAGITAIILALVVIIFGELMISALTDIQAIREEASNSLILIAIYIFLSVAAFQLDGIFIGASFTAQMRDAATISLLVFLFACWILVPSYQIEGLWWAMIVYVVARAGALLIFYPSLRRSLSV